MIWTMIRSDVLMAASIEGEVAGMGKTV